MNRTLILSAVAVLALAACTPDVEVEQTVPHPYAPVVEAGDPNAAACEEFWSELDRQARLGHTPDDSTYRSNVSIDTRHPDPTDPELLAAADRMMELRDGDTDLWLIAMGEVADLCNRS